MNIPILDQEPDVEVLFEFNGTRKNPATDGYRPHHLVTGNYLKLVSITIMKFKLFLLMVQQKAQSLFSHRMPIRVAYG